MAKTAVITGSSQGIGAATVEVFARAGYNVVITYFKSQDIAETLAKQCEAHGVRALVVEADCSTEAGLQRLADETVKTFGKVDVLINNFGLGEEPDFKNLTQENIIAVLNNTLIPTILATRIFVPDHMTTPAAVLNVSSIYGLPQSGSAGIPVYSAGKAGVINFTETCAKIFAPGIRCNAVAPGFTKTPHWDHIDPARAQACIDSTLLKEWVQPEDIAEALLFLARSPHITAQTITVDAGWSKR